MPGSDGGSSGNDQGTNPDATLPRSPGACSSLDDVGVWESVLPSQVSIDPNFQTPAGQNFGAHSFVINPQDSSVVYLGTSAQGIFKSADCGATWVHVDTGRNASMIDSGRQWTFQIDPVDPDVLYTNTGYGPSGSIAWKSTNGGVDWDPFISDTYVKALQYGDFVHMITLDASDHQHLIVTPHFDCVVGAVAGLPKTTNCLLETKDGGATWEILEGTPGSGEGAGQWIVDSKNWFWAANSGGLYRTTDGGGSWLQVYGGGYATPSVLRLSSGTSYVGGVFNLLASADGMTWTPLQNSPGASNVTGDDKVVFVVRDATYSSTNAPASNTSTWTSLATPPFPTPNGASTWDLKYDPDHHVLYSLNNTNGFWRMRTE